MKLFNSFEFKVKDLCWFKLCSSMLINLGICLRESFLSYNLEFQLQFDKLTIKFDIIFPEDYNTEINEYIQSYASVLLRKKPLNELFSDHLQLIQFKQHLDLSALELKLYRDAEDNSIVNNQEIFELHDYLAIKLLEDIQIKS